MVLIAPLFATVTRIGALHLPFSTAFKRAYGASPLAWRRTAARAVATG